MKLTITITELNAFEHMEDFWKGTDLIYYENPENGQLAIVKY